jgi:hypothetical protein
MQLGKNSPFENIAVEIKDNCRIVSYLCDHYPQLSGKTKVFFIIRVRKRLIINGFDQFFLFENIALEIEANRKTVSIHNNARNENLERLIMLFGRRGSTFRFFFVRWTRQRGYDQLFSLKQVGFFPIFIRPLFFARVSEMDDVFEIHSVRFLTRPECHGSISSFFLLHALPFR